MTDPYKILGLTKTATLDEIKKSYRKLAKKYHPDLNPGNKESEKKFKELSHAFDLIGTEEARNKYDRGETDEHRQHNYEQRQRSGSERYSSSFAEGMDPNDLFESLFGRANRHGPQGGHFAGEDELYKMEVELIEAAHGGEKTITLPNGKKLQIKIPAGIESGKKLKFKGLGNPGHGGPAGDVYIEITVKPIEGFTRVLNDIHSEVAISFFEAVHGAEIPVPTLDGSVMLKIPAGVSTGSKLRVKNKGIGPEGSRGNQIVALKIVMPKHMNPGLIEALTKLEAEFAYDPRKNA